MSAPSREAEIRGQIATLLRIARQIRDPEHPLGIEARAALRATSSLSPEGLELALRFHLEVEASETEIASLLAEVSQAPRCHVVLSANVCTGALRALALAVATAPHVELRPSSRDPGLAPILARELAKDALVDVRLVRQLAAQPRDEVHAYGSDSTNTHLEHGLSPGVVFRAHGHGFGLAIVGRAASAEEAAEALARDIVPFDQQGCLSPRAAWILGDERRARAIGEALAVSLERWERDVPRGALGAEVKRELAVFERTMRAVGEVMPSQRHVIAVSSVPVTLAPAARAMLLVPSESTGPFAAWLDGVSRYVTTIGSTPEPSSEELGLALPFARRAVLGWMQRPPLDGPVDRRTRARAIS